MACVKQILEVFFLSFSFFLGDLRRKFANGATEKYCKFCIIFSVYLNLNGPEIEKKNAFENYSRELKYTIFKVIFLLSRKMKREYNVNIMYSTAQDNSFF